MQADGTAHSTLPPSWPGSKAAFAPQDGPVRSGRHGPGQTNRALLAKGLGVRWCPLGLAALRAWPAGLLSFPRTRLRGASVTYFRGDPPTPSSLRQQQTGYNSFSLPPSPLPASESSLSTPAFRLSSSAAGARKGKPRSFLRRDHPVAS